MKHLFILAIVILNFISSHALATPGQRKFIVLTDLEPDDRIALHLLAANFNPDEIKLVGTTVMNSTRKMVLVKRLMKQLGLESVPVVQGSGGISQSYPDIASSRAAREYQNEGHDILSKKTLNELSKAPVNNGALLQQKIYEILSTNTDVEIVVLSPPTDLVAVLERYPSLMTNIQRLHVMGGWVQTQTTDGATQLRATYNWNMDPVSSAALMKLSIPMLLYSSHMIKPSFSGGSINSANFPEIMASMSNAAASLQSLKDGSLAGESWDSHLIEKIPPLKNVIGAHVGKQFTPADPAVIVGITSPDFLIESRKVTINIKTEDVDPGKGYLVEVLDNPKSPIVLVEKVNPEVFKRETVQSFEKLPQITTLRRCGHDLTATLQAPR